MNKIIRVTLPCVIALLALAALFFVVAASAEASSPQPGPQSGLTVTTLEDELNTDGDCSLREALTAANTNLPVDACGTGDAVLTDTITFTVSGTITVTSQLVASLGGPLMVDGGGVITTSGGGATRVWWVDAGSVLTLQGLGVVDGYVSGDSGAGIYNDGGELAVRQCNFLENRANNGGAISNNTGTLDIMENTFVNNTAWGGGGIYNYQGVLTVTHSTFISNTADSKGGGIFNNLGDLSVSQSSFSNNRVYLGSSYEGGGGAINHLSYGGDNFSVDQCVFSDNRSMYGGRGGAINIAAFSDEEIVLSITSSTFTGNQALEYGGAFAFYNGSSNARVLVRNSTFVSNHCSGSGGAIANGGKMTVIGSVVSQNTGSSGGGIANNNYSGGDLTVINSTISANTAVVKGGGITNGPWGPGTLAVINSTVVGNGAADGGGIHTPVSYSDGIFAITNTIIANNLSGGDCNGPIIDGGHNLDSDDTCGLDPANGSLPGIDPLLGPLQGNGGPTLTHALLPGSPAIDTGDDAQCPPTDQRGVPRPLDGDHDGTAVCDIGAYEAYYGAIYYAAPAAQGNGDCLTWADACTLQTALSIASNRDQIWVQAGTHLPTSGTDRTVSFALKNGVAIYGGFVGDETELSQRDWNANLTILSGDIGITGVITDNVYHVVTGSGITNTAVLDGFTISGGYADGSTVTDTDGGGMYNVYSSPSLENITFSGNSASNGGGMDNELSSSPGLVNVIFSDNTAWGDGGGMANYDNSSPSLENVIFSNNVALYERGGGMYNYWYSSPSLVNVTFSGNTAHNSGGGMYNYWRSSPSLENVIFSGNMASTIASYEYGGGGMYNAYSSPSLVNVTFSGNTALADGGGMANYDNCHPSLVNVTFSGNSAHIGGGMANYNNSNPSLTDVTFGGNMAEWFGGGVYNLGSSPSLVNVTFSSNTATQDGGGMDNDYYSSPSLVNVTFSGNTALSDGGGMYNYNNSSPSLTNCILWGNTAGGSPSQIDGDATVTYSDIQGGWPGEGNIDIDPLLGPLQDNGGSTLTHALLWGSPAIDAGDNTQCPATDQRGVPRPYDGDFDGTPVCDIGAYEFVYGIYLNPAQQSASAIPGSTLAYTLTLYNFTPLTDTYSLALGPHAWETNLSAFQVGPLEPGEISVFTASITIPLDAPWYQSDSVVITATSVTSPTIYSDTAHLTTQAYAPPQISITPLTLDSMQYPGELITQTLTISNGNGVPLNFTIHGTAAWLAIAPSSGSVNTLSALPVQVFFQAGSHMSGAYTTTLVITTNDPINPLVSVPVTMIVTPVAPAAITIAGPSDGLANQLYTFTTTVEPLTTTLPITYTWQVDGQEPITHTDGLSDAASFVWPAEGVYSVTVTATNSVGSVSATTRVRVSPLMRYYLPWMQRDTLPPQGGGGQGLLGLGGVLMGCGVVGIWRRKGKARPLWRSYPPGQRFES